MSSPRWIGPAAALAGVLLVAWAWWLEQPPAAVAADAPLEVFAAGRALTHLHEIAVRPHMTGSAEHARVREYLVDELQALGFETEVQRATVVNPLGGLVRSATVRNVVARRRGSDPSGGVAIATHYDSQQLTPGAGDDGAGVAATLEALRALQGGEPLRNDLYVLITDAEELGLLGAQALVAEHRWWPEIDVLLSFEARGNAGQSAMFETNEESGWVVREYLAADPYPTGSSLFYEVYRRMPNDTDFTIYKRGGVVGLGFGLAEGADVYHRPSDSIDNLSPASLQHHGAHALALLRHFGALDLATATSAPNVVYFRVAWLGLVSYPAAWVGALTLLVLVFCGAVVERGFRRRRMTAGGTVVGLALSVVAIAASAGLAALLWRLVSPLHHELGSVQGRALYSETWYVLALAAIVVAVVCTLFALARRFCGVASLTGGVLLVPLALALIGWWAAPGLNMLFLWPALFVAGALRYLLSRPPEQPAAGADLAAVVVLSAPVVLFIYPLIWAVHVGLSITAAPVTAGCAALMVVMLLPLLEIAQQRGRVWLPAAAAGLALAFALTGVIDARPGPARPVPSDLVYTLDRESGISAWATMQPGDDGWIERFVPAGAETRDLAPFLAGNPRPYRLAAAPPVDAPPAVVRVAADEISAGVRHVRLQVESAIAPELINVSPAPGSTVSLNAVNGVGVPPALDPDAARNWLLQHFGRPPGGVLTLDVAGDAASPMDLVLVEFLMRLPPLAGVDTERPAGWTPYARRLTDTALFRQVIPLGEAAGSRSSMAPPLR